jgi:hypothetical protein
LRVGQPTLIKLIMRVFTQRRAGQFSHLCAITGAKKPACSKVMTARELRFRASIDKQMSIH